MCNLYSIKTKRSDLARKFMLSDNRMAPFEPLPAIFPDHMAPIITQSADKAATTLSARAASTWCFGEACGGTYAAARTTRPSRRSLRVEVHVERLGRCSPDDVLTGEQIDGNDGAHGVMLPEVFRIIRGTALAAAAYPLGWCSLRNGMVFI
jgi:hypothetical protein